MNFYLSLETVLECERPDEKLAAFEAFYERFPSLNTQECPPSAPKYFEAPSYVSWCRVVDPKVVPRRKNLRSSEGKIAMLHAIAHIEYSAIDLALDAAYRFRGLPREFYEAWLSVAADEVRHFRMLEALLQELGSYYGALEVHDGLFEASQRTAHSLLHRMAVVPRYLEAGGLDATPQILQKLEPIADDPLIGKIVDALHVILREEIDHVHKGDRWFAYACEREGADKSSYFDIIEHYYEGTFARKRHLNASARLEAGFTCNELERIASQKIC